MSTLSTEKEFQRNRFLKYLLNNNNLDFERLVEPIESDSFMVHTMNRLFSREPVGEHDFSLFVAEFYRASAVLKSEFLSHGVGPHWKYQAYMCYSMRYLECNVSNDMLKQFFSHEDSEQNTIVWLFDLLRSNKYQGCKLDAVNECYKFWISWCANEVTKWIKKRKSKNIVFCSSPPDLAVFDPRRDIILLEGPLYSMMETGKISLYLSSGTIDEHNKVLSNIHIPKQEGIKICPSLKTVQKASQSVLSSPSLQQTDLFV
jgi:hypothetical protein